MGLNCQLFAVLLGGLFAASAKDAGAGASPVIVHSNGVITATLTRTNSSQTPGKTSVATFDFGLPPAPPQRRWMDDEKLPVLRTQWEWRGVRYIQTVMLSRLAEMEFEDELRRVKQYWSDDRRDKKSTALLDWAGAKP